VTAVDVWLLAEADVPRLAGSLAPHRLLSGAERRRLERMHSPGGRVRYLGARLLCRGVLAARIGCDPAALGFAVGPFGRPELSPNPWRLRFNLSATDGLLACVVVPDRLCGIDVEGFPLNPDAVRFGSQWLAPAERARLAGLDGRPRSSEFVDTWVLKEAYAKALGAGMRHRFEAFMIDRTPGGRVLLTDPTRPAGETGRWQFLLCAAGRSHRLAVAVRRNADDAAELPARIREFELDKAFRDTTP